MAMSRTRLPPGDLEKGKLARGRGRRRKRRLLSDNLTSNSQEQQTIVLSTASGLLAMLKEQHPILKLHALNNLNACVDNFWPEISVNINQIEVLYEDEHFEHRNLAALVVSKVFYYLGELNDALSYALGAGSLFDVSQNSEYVQTMVAKCVDEYISINVRREKGEEECVSLDPRLVTVVDRMLDQCLLDGKSQQAVGIALECRRLDKLEEALLRSQNPYERLLQCLKLSQTFVSCREFRREVLRLLVDNFQKLQEPDYLSICQCLMLLDEPQQVTTILEELLQGGNSQVLLAYQVAFDLFENENQRFLTKVNDLLHASASRPESSNVIMGVNPSSEVSPHVRVVPPERGQNTMQIPDENSRQACDCVVTTPPSTSQPDLHRVREQNSKGDSGEAEHDVGHGPRRKERETYLKRLNKLKGILIGDIPINLTLQFLHSHNRSDLMILKAIKQSLESRNSICHGATIYMNALMHTGTTVDTFLRENLDWLSRTTNWAKFSATAGLGVIHKGHLLQGISLLAPYLPQPRGSPFSEGGALYALGLIYVNHGEGIKHFLVECLRNATHEVVQHGACLGLGLAGIGTADDEIYEELKGVLYADSAVSGEAAGIAMGLLYAGAGPVKAGEMLAYAQDTQHEKITRGIALGIALTVYGQEDEADPLIERMTRDQSACLRYGGMFAWAMAYRGTANNTAIRRLLHFAVSDVSDDVRRTAVIALGFVLCTEPEQTPRIVSLLAESYNPHVRYGVSLALGISCAGSGSKRAIALLETLVVDPVDFVRQGGLIGMAMVLLQRTETQDSHVGWFRKHIENIVNDRHEEAMTKMGAILAQGILDAGGRNVGILMQSKNGQCRMTAIAGMAVFCQFWYWYPLIYFISLSFSPTSFIGLTEELRIPKFNFICEAKPSMFAYPQPLQVQVEAPMAKFPTAVLSVAAKKVQPPSEQDQKMEGVKNGKRIMQEASTSYPLPNSPAFNASTMAFQGDCSISTKGDTVVMQSQAEQQPKSIATGESLRGPVHPASSMSNVKAVDKDGDDAQPSQSGHLDSPEPKFEVLQNPTRVVPSQKRYISFPDNCRYVPLQPKKFHSGFVMLQDLSPFEPAEYVWDVDVYTAVNLRNPFGAPGIIHENNDSNHANPFLQH